MVTQIKNNIANNLIRIRVARRYSQRELALVLSIKQPSYREMEMGKTQVNAIQLAILADFYAVPVQCFYQKDMTLDQLALPGDGQTHSLHDRVEHYKALAEIYAKRITELEGKLQRRDAKIDTLLAASRRLFEGGYEQI